MVEEKRDDRSRRSYQDVSQGIPHARQRNEMMDNFTQILQRLSTMGEAPSTSNHFGGATPFKVQVNFDIPLFEGQIDAYALEKWLNLLEGYYSIQKKIPHRKDHLRAP
jgi:hypothetical protein